jgi:ubiquinone/menaquinone biosynthesis C-methylase UbiE
MGHMAPGGRVLEVGCGGGQNRAWVASRRLEYVGIDYSRTRVFEWLQRHGGPDLLCDAHFLPFRDQVFDCVYSAAVLEHLAHPRLAVREMYRTLKPGGSCLGTVAFLEPLHDDSFFHMSPIGVLEILTAQGFEVTCIWPGEPRWSVFYSVPFMAFRRPLSWLRHLGRVVYALYALQNRVLNLARAATGRRRVPEIFTRSVVAGSIYWIARRPIPPGEQV